MATNLQTTATFYRIGATPISGGCIGYENGVSRKSVARYEFTTPSTGATSISWRSNACYLTNYYYDDGSGTTLAWQYCGSFNWIITDDGDAYKSYIGNDGYSIRASAGNYYYGSANINLLPNKTYYLFVYPNNSFKNMYAIFGIGGLSFLTVDGAYGVSSVVATNANIGNASTISISRYSDTFTHTLQYKIAGQSSFTNIVSKTDQISYSWTVPVATYNLLPSTDRSIEITLKCSTYSGNTLLGDSETTITAYAVESECKPTISASYSLLNDCSALTGNNTTAILNWSIVRISVSATGRNGASISSYAIINSGNTYNVATYDFDPIQTPTFTYRATDTRGYVSEGNLTITSINYTKPTITLNVVPPNTQTGATKIKGSGKLFWGSFGQVSNSATISYRYKISGGNYGNWVDIPTTITSSNYQTPEETITLNYREKYVFQGRIVDALNTTLTPEISVVALPVFDWGKDDFQFNVAVIFSPSSYGSSLPQSGQEGQVFFKI